MSSGGKGVRKALPLPAGLLVVVLLGLLPGAGALAQTYCLRVDGEIGGSPSGDCAGGSDLFGVSDTTRQTGTLGIGGFGPSEVPPLFVSKAHDSITSALLLSLFTGSETGQVTIEGRPSAGMSPFLVIVLGKVKVVHFEHSWDPTGAVNETVGFWFDQIQWTLNGTTSCWERSTASPVCPPP